MAVKARNAGQTKIPVYIFPHKLNETEQEDLKIDQAADRAHLDFWQNLKVGYDLFERKKSPIKFSVDKSGNYRFSP